MSQEIIWFLKTEYQEAIEKSEYLFRKQAPEETPYQYKYEARKILEDLIKNENFQEINEEAEIQENVTDEQRNNPEFISKQYLIASKMIINFHLAANYQETEEGHLSKPFYIKALKLISQIDKQYVHHYFNYLQGIYNILGLMYLNTEENTLGMQLLGKADDLYVSITESKVPQINIINNSQEYLNNELQQFSYIFEGGLSSQKTESLYTHTLFFLAQGYTKCDKKELAADYCGRTMKRQFESNTHDLKDFCVNCMSLAEFYGNIKNFQQAEYLILAALSLLPEGRKHKMRATLQMSLGFLLHQYMEVSVKILNEDRLKDTEENEKMYNNMKLTFNGIENICKPVTVKKDIEEVKSIFRQANTYFKKALEYFILDGFVTEHIQIVQHQSDLYQFLQILESNPKSLIGLCERRLGLLEPIFKVINPKSYQEKYQKLLVDIAEIYNFMFELQYKQLFVDSQAPPKAKQLQKMNMFGSQVIVFYTQIHQILLDDKDTERDSNFYNSLITAKFNVAKAYSKVYMEGRKNRVEALVNSLNAYKWIEKYIRESVPEDIKKNNHEFDQQQNMCVEMIDLLPSKIDKANCERWEGEQ